MKDTASLKHELERIRVLCDQGRYANAFARAERLRKRCPENAHVLMMWGNLLQLQDEKTGPPLEEARAALQRAVDVDEHGPKPLIELGHYLFALDDDSKAAVKCFEQAIQLCKRLLKEALLGKAGALADLDKRQEALACLAEAYWFESRNGKGRNGAEASDVFERFEALRRAE